MSPLKRSDVPTNEQVLSAIESLKRVIGIPDHSEHSDAMHKSGVLIVHTPDLDSARILNALFVYFVHGTRPVFEFDRDGRRKRLNVPRFVHDTRKPEADCEVTAYLTPAKRRIFMERLEDYVDTFIAPSKKSPLNEPERSIPTNSRSR